ncbi:MAG: SoxR reducing system RseC family protein [Bacteroidales bacterium]|jgi:sigma-E factor negative regulatory protein RseC|nr:SoxR reducing system RseC family protein [Bacteroidales bacterium]
METKNIKEKGRIIAVSSEEVEVLIERKAACVGCSARNACQSLDKKDQYLKIPTTNAASFQIDEDVVVEIEQSLGIKAVIIAFVIPPIIMIAAIAILTLAFTGINQSFIAIIALIVYAIYCFILYFLREKISKHFVLRVKHLNTNIDAYNSFRK